MIEKLGRPSESRIVHLPGRREFEFDLHVEGVVLKCGPSREPVFLWSSLGKDGRPMRGKRPVDLRDGPPRLTPGMKVLYSEACEVELDFEEHGNPVVAVYVPNVLLFFEKE